VVEEQLQASQANNPQIGLTLIPEQPIDFSTLDANLNNTWGLGNLPAGLWGNTRPQVFTVTEIPEGPPVDIDGGVLSGKSSDLIGSFCSLDEGKSEMPRVESIPAVNKPGQQPNEMAPADLEELDESDPAFALFVDGPEPISGSATTQPGSEWALHCPKRFDCVEFGKTRDLVTSVEQGQREEDSEAARMEHFRRLCRSTEAAFERISRMTSHLHE
jgi:hypothetical protein